MIVISFLKEITTSVFGIIRSPIDSLKKIHGISLYRNAVYLMSTNIQLAVTGFIFWVVAARLYSTEAVGLASAAVSAMTLIALLSELGLTFAIIRFLHSTSDKASDMFNSCWTVSGFTAIALSVIFLIGLDLWAPALLRIREELGFFIVFVIAATAMTLQTLTRQTFVSRRNAVYALGQSLTFGLLRFFPLIALASVFETFGIFISWGVASLAAVAVSISLLIPKVLPGYRLRPFISKSILTRMFKFSIANYITNIFQMLSILVFPLMVVNSLGAEENAYFYVAWAIGQVLFIIPTSLSLSLFAEGAHHPEKLKADFIRSLKLILVTLCPAIVVVLLIGDKLLLLFGEGYSENGATLLWLLALSALPLSLVTLYCSIERVRMHMERVIMLSLAIAIIALGMAQLLLPRMGIEGIGIAWLTAQTIAASIVVLLLCKRDHAISSTLDCLHKKCSDLFTSV